ncbi:MAG: DUF1018 domain-containing protein [Deferrisomatales bacterium]|nr:DUF1018 domain-containing protein [Deferrisomatales bacterium]
MRPITKRQIRKIHTLKTAMGMADDHYRALLQVFDVSSSKNLTEREAALLIARMEEGAIERGVWKPYGRVVSQGPIGDRPGYATVKQREYIEGLWNQASHAGTEKGRQHGLRTFLYRSAKVSDLRFVTSDQAVTVITIFKDQAAQSRRVRTAQTESAPHAKGAIG